MAEEEHAVEIDLVDPSSHVSTPHTTSQLLLAARVLAGSSPESTAERGPLSSILSQRLTKARAEFSELSIPTEYKDLNTEQLQSATGYAALKLSEAIDAALGTDAAKPGAGTSLLGAKDKQVLRTTASLIFHWALDPILNRLSSQWKGNLPTPGVAGGPDVREAATLLKRLHTLLHQDSTRTPVSDILAVDHPVETLRGLLMLGWLSPGVCPESSLLRAGAMKLLGSVALDISIQYLGSALSRVLPPHARTAATYLLSRRLMHPQGIRALFYSTFEDDIAADMIQRFDAVSQLLSLPPKGINTEEYLRAVIPRLVHILQDTQSPATHHRAAAYCIAHMLDSSLSQTASDILFPIFHRAFTFGNQDHPESPLSPPTSVTTLSRLLTTFPPTGGIPFVLRFVSPILGPLYSLVAYLDRTPTAEPSVRENARSLFDAWAKLVPAEEGVLLLWSIVDGSGGDWELVDDGDGGLILGLVQRSQDTTILLSELNGLIDGDLNANPLNLRPDPTHFTELIYKVGRKELSSLFFVHLLDAYQGYSVRPIDPTRALLLLQLLHHMQSLADSSAFLSKPERVLPFIDYALQGRASTNIRDSTLIREGPFPTLHFVRHEDDDDDDARGDMMRTAVNLLLSLLEANPEFKPSPTATPIARIAARLGELTVHESLALRQAAREAGLVLTARQAAAEGPSVENSIQVTGDDPTELSRKRSYKTYQEALRLLQDPLLPVRAHGLSLLRHMMAGDHSAAAAEHALDPALVPAILNIFLQSVQEEDSYIFLNAVQGLGVMAEKSGRDVFLGLLRIYTGNTNDTGELSRTELDLRLRIGEAISEVLKRTWPSLNSYAGNILPSLLFVVRNRHFPTALRMSAISLLSRCTDAAPDTMLLYSHEIGEAMLDLLQLETVVSVEKKRDEKLTAQDDHRLQDAASSYITSKHIVQTGDIEMDSDPLQKDAKLPPLRRSAIHLLTVLAKAFLHRVYESGASGVHGSLFSVQRGLTMLRYIAKTDADNTVRVLAAEGADLLAQLRRVVPSADAYIA